MSSLMEYVAEVAEQRNALAENLTEQGVDASNTETLNSLVPKVLDIKNISLILMPITKVVSRRNYIDSGRWIAEVSNRCKTIWFRVKGGRTYRIQLGAVVGSRFRVAFFEDDVTDSTVTVQGTSIISGNNPKAFQSIEYTTPSDGYIGVGVTNAAEYNVTCYLLDLSIFPGTEGS